MKSPIKSVATARFCLGHFTGKESFWWDGQTPLWGFFSPLAITNIQCLIPQVGDSLCLTEPVRPVRGAAVWGRHLEDNSLLSTGFIFLKKVLPVPELAGAAGQRLLPCAGLWAETC